MNMTSDVSQLGGKKRRSGSKKSGSKSRKTGMKTGIPGLTRRRVVPSQERLTPFRVAEEISDERRRVGGSGPNVMFVDNAITQLRLLESSDPHMMMRLKTMAVGILDSVQDMYSTDTEFIDLRQKLDTVSFDSGVDYDEVDRQDMLSVIRILLRQVLLKQRPTVKVYDFGRAVSKHIKDFVKTINESCPPINEPNKTEEFYTQDGHLSCRVPMDKKRVPVRGVGKGNKNTPCPPFPGSRRTQHHVQADGTAVCREPVRAGAHECPEPIYRNGDEVIYVDPLATVHETLPGGVGVCKRPFAVPAMISYSGPQLLPSAIDMAVTVKSTKPGQKKEVSARPARTARRSPARRGSPSRSARRSPARRGSPRRSGSKNRM